MNVFHLIRGNHIICPPERTKKTKPASKPQRAKVLFLNRKQEVYATANEIFRYPTRGRTDSNITDAQHVVFW